MAKKLQGKIISSKNSITAKELKAAKQANKKKTK
jgi:hypothetical protein